MTTSPAQQLSFEPVYDASVWTYVHNGDNTARYLLGTQGQRTLVCFGINTSTAEPNKLDPTVTKVRNIALRNGYDSFMMMNVYPQRATDPNDLHGLSDPQMKADNEHHIAHFINGGTYDIVAAWGNLIDKRPYLYPNLQAIAQLPELAQCNWFHLGTLTKGGHPRHPLYLRLDVSLNSFDITAYTQRQS